MALLAESLVEEWLNRQNFFTIRGVKHGIDEIDLLAIKASAPVDAWHVEVQVSLRPVGYIAKLSNAMRQELKRAPTSAMRRTPEQIKECARDWVEAKFRSKREVRDNLWPGVAWSFHLVHGEVRDEAELSAFKDEGVKCHLLTDLLDQLSKRGSFSGSAGGDLAEIVHYYQTTKNRLS